MVKKADGPKSYIYVAYSSDGTLEVGTPMNTKRDARDQYVMEHTEQGQNGFFIELPLPWEKPANKAEPVEALEVWSLTK